MKCNQNLPSVRKTAGKSIHSTELRIGKALSDHKGETMPSKPHLNLQDGGDTGARPWEAIRAGVWVELEWAGHVLLG